MSDPLERCPLTAAVEIIGGKWTLIVLYALSQQPRRFNELQRLAPGISHKVLTQTVRALENHGLVIREVADTAVPCVQYSLSDDGATLRPIVETIAAWGREHLDLRAAPGPQGALPKMPVNKPTRPVPQHQSPIINTSAPELDIGIHGAGAVGDL